MPEFVIYGSLKYSEIDIFDRSQQYMELKNRSVQLNDSEMDDLVNRSMTPLWLVEAC